jgi:hypothetical protein
MAIKFSCGSCDKKFVAKDEHAGRASNCPACGWPISVPKEVVWELELDPELSPPPLPAKPPAPVHPTSPSQSKRWRPIIGVPEVAGAIILTVAALIIAIATTFESRRPPNIPVLIEERGTPAPRYTFLDRYIDRTVFSKDGKDIFSIRLPRKVSRDALKEIALEFHETKPPNPRTGMGNFRTIVYFYLPEVDAFGPDGPFGPPWAMVDHNSPLLKSWEEVVINGFTIDEEIKRVAKWIPPAGDVIGLWIEDSIEKSLWCIYRRDGAFYLGLGQGNKLEEALVGFGPQPFRLFERKKPSKAGDYYRINERGDLEMRDDKGLISVAWRVTVD